MPASLTAPVLSEILRAYVAKESGVPSVAALKGLADSSETSVQAVKNRYLALYMAAGNEDDPFAPLGGPYTQDDPAS
jgi:hypothetical protein